MLTVGSILMVPVIIASAGGSVLLISKVGCKMAGKKIRHLNGMTDDEGKQ